MSEPRVLIVGNPGEEHIGSHLLRAARTLGIEATLFDLRLAWGSNRLLNSVAFRFAGRRPTRLGRFGSELVQAATRFRPTVAIVTGISAPDAGTLRALRATGIRVANYLTDDPWNPANDARFFRESLLQYDAVYSPRRANLPDLERHGCARVAYLPFAYDPAIHYPEPPATDQERARFACDVAIVGGADADRVPIARALADAGLRLRLFGGYWDRWRETRPFHCGFAVGRDLRMAVGGATVNVCMVRRANRDGHSMRSLEVPAMGGGMVAEDTREHRELFDGCAEPVDYFSTLSGLVESVQSLCADPARAARGAAALRTHITQRSAHTYADRLRWMLRDLAT
jgi:hypothetical protein